MISATTPPGYDAFLVRDARVVARADSAAAVREALATGPIHAWASRQPGARAVAGRGTAWSAALPNGVEVVVRHSRHGGALAAVTRDLFFAPTRAPRELANALRLASAGVPTPDVVAYAVYPATWPLVRADIATLLMRGSDLPDAWRASASEPEREAIMRAVAALLGRMRDAGARHPDLNLKNVFVTGRGDGTTAILLDVDRVVFGAPGSEPLAARNITRLLRSGAKWNAEHDLRIDWQRYLSPSGHATRRRTSP